MTCDGIYEAGLPAGYEVRRQSKDYLYGWNWFAGSRKGYGYRTKGSAMRAAFDDASAANQCTCTIGDFNELQDQHAQSCARAAIARARGTNEKEE